MISNKLQKHSIFQGLALLGLSFVIHFPAIAQQDELQTRIDAATSALQRLDIQASACLSALDETNSDDSAQQSCSEFLASVDGELLAGYLANCESLKIWLDDFVSDEIINSAVTTDDNAANSETNLQLLVGIEFSCGEDALQKRTEFVSRAFSLLQGSQAQTQRANAGLGRRLDELKFDSTLNNERRLLQNSVLQESNRRELETERQMNDLENELIRQQINRER